MDKIDEFLELIDFEKNLLTTVEVGANRFARCKEDMTIIIDTLLESGYLDFAVRISREFLKEHFTPAEMDQMIGFNKTPAGQKTLKLLPVLSDTVHQKSGEFVNEVWPKVEAALDLARAPAANKLES